MSPLLMNSNSVADAAGRSDPNIVALKIHAENIVVSRRRLDLARRRLPGRVPNNHLGLAAVEARPVDGPILAVEVRKSLVGGEPAAPPVQGLYLVQKVAWQTAVFVEEVVPVPAVV